jgi:L-threonylcarbamoyladenylate synthase
MIVSPTPTHLEQACHILREGGLIGLPTETVYGLAADATQDFAVASIFSTKRRPTFNPLILHGPSPKAFRPHVQWNETAEVLAQTFWPGPLTLVLPRLASSPLSLLVSAGLDSLAIRVPAHPVALSLLRTCGLLLAAPSANPSGRVSPTQARHVEEDFSDLFILDGGDTSVGLESTIIDLTGPIPLLLRPGGLAQEKIEECVGPLGKASVTTLKAPGMMASHYAPACLLRLNAEGPVEGEAYLAFGPTPHRGEDILNLSPKGDLIEAAANFFRMLRALDRPNVSKIAVAPIPRQGLGIALNDRLLRAAVPREHVEIQ